MTTTTTTSVAPAQTIIARQPRRNFGYGIPRHIAMKLGLPKGWTGCPKFGDVIDGTFVPMKTPLSFGYDGLLRPDQAHHPDDIFTTMFNGAEEGAKVKLVISLTNTERYYGQKTIANNECRYEWLPIVGHAESPSVEQTEKFVQLVREFKRDHPDDLIAVHCTHGFNRTGFLIVAYLVMEGKMSLKAAVNAFVDARSPGIYKDYYLTDLCHRFVEGYTDGDPLPVIVPERPSWD